MRSARLPIHHGKSFRSAVGRSSTLQTKPSSATPAKSSGSIAPSRSWQNDFAPTKTKDQGGLP